ncbi:MAG: hypothetical protein KDB57_01660 [Solirubrobacterales bacterium]|nr:hypothetical protein [Solirubrobacterales bacterium]
MKTILRSIVGITGIAIALVCASPAQAGLSGYNPCDGPNHPTYEWMGDMYGVQVEVPSVASSGPGSFNGVVFGPAAPESIEPSGPKLPVVVLQHGAGETDSTICAMSWAAKYLAGHGYITEIHQAPDAAGQGGQFLNGVRATASAVEFLRSPANPYAAITDVERVGVGGSSMGSIVSSYIQGNPPVTDGLSIAAGLDLSQLDVDAIIAYDSLRRWVTGDPGAAANECTGDPALPVIPRVPALSFAMDAPCKGNPSRLDPDLKQYGWRWWRDSGIPSLSLVLKDFEHTDFSHNGDENQRLIMAHWTKRWYDRWLKSQPGLEQEILARTVNSQSTSTLLSSQFLSGVCLGPVNTDDYAAWLAGNDPASNRNVLGDCQTPERPTGLRVVGGSPAVSVSPKVRGNANPEARISIFDNRNCSGEAIATGSGSRFNSGGLTVRVRKGSSNRFFARAVNPTHGQESDCSTSFASFQQAFPDLGSPVLTGPRKIRPGRSLILRLRVTNRGKVAANQVRVRLASSNSRVRVSGPRVLPKVRPRSTSVAKIRLRALASARGRVRIKATVGGRTSVRVLRVRRSA